MHALVHHFQIKSQPTNRIPDPQTETSDLPHCKNTYQEHQYTALTALDTPHNKTQITHGT